MKNFNTLDTDEEWVKVITQRLGTRLNLTEKQIYTFAMAIEKVIPEMLRFSEIFHPEREIVKSLKEKADKLVLLLDEIRTASEKSEYAKDIIDFSLAHKAHRMDFLDIYWFGDAFQGFLNDAMAKMKPGPDITSELNICQCICNVYSMALGVEPACYSYDRISESGDIDDGTPYERVCHEIKLRYKLDISWSTIRKATQTYKEAIRSAKSQFSHSK